MTFVALLTEQLGEITGNKLRERRSVTQQRLGLEPGAAAARTKPLYMGRCSAS